MYCYKYNGNYALYKMGLYNSIQALLYSLHDHDQDILDLSDVTSDYNMLIL